MLSQLHVFDIVPGALVAATPTPGYSFAVVLCEDILEFVC